MKILIADKLDEKGIKIFEDKGFNVIKKYTITKDELIKEIEKYEGVVVRSRTTLSADILEHAKNLKVIGRAGVGLDNIDVNKAEEMGIKVFNTPEAPSVSVAELTIGLMISLARHVSKADETLHNGKWLKNDYLGNTLKDKKIGLIGFGNIGQAVAKRCVAFEMEIGIYDVLPDIIEKAKKLGFRIYKSVDELIKESQIISLHVPANPHTENMINNESLKLMKKESILINTSRGKLIDESALAKALKNKEIRGAALDVFREEPLKNKELMDIKDNLILTPHLGAQTDETQVDAATMIAEIMSDYLKSI